MNIMVPQVEDYLSGLYRPVSAELAALRAESEDAAIPIILKDTESLLLNLVRLKKPKRILEVGTAVGYSALCFAEVSEDCEIVTLESSERMYQEASANIERAGKGGRIQVVFGDAAESLKRLREQKDAAETEFERYGMTFDMVFIDASKGHYQEFFDACFPLCRKDAMILSDNVLYKGITASDEFLESRRNKTIANRMRDYLLFLAELPDASTSVLAVGDGFAITLRDNGAASQYRQLQGSLEEE